MKLVNSICIAGHQNRRSKLTRSELFSIMSPKGDDINNKQPGIESFHQQSVFQRGSKINTMEVLIQLLQIDQRGILLYLRQHTFERK